MVGTCVLCAAFNKLSYHGRMSHGRLLAESPTRLARLSLLPPRLCLDKLVSAALWQKRHDAVLVTGGGAGGVEGSVEGVRSGPPVM